MRKRFGHLVLTSLLLASVFTLVFSFYQLRVPVSAASTFIVLSPNAGGSGTTVQVTGNNFKPTDNSCSISSTGPAGLLSSTTCTMSGGMITSASFVVVDNPTPGSYQVIVTGAAGGGDTAQAPFSVPSITATPRDGPQGTKVSITGSGFDGLSTSCTITSTTAGLVTSPTSCIISSGSISPGTGTFIIGGGVSSGDYTIIITTNSGVRATTTITVDTQPAISLKPVLGPPGQIVQVTQSSGQFSKADTACTITGSIVSTSACNILNGLVQSTSQFQVKSTAVPGTYTITVTGSVSMVTATATFTVTSTTPVIVVTPTDGPFGTFITVQGTGFSSSDSSCQITSDVVNVVASQSCSAGGGKIGGSFTVGSTSPGLVHITVTGNLGDSATTTFTIDVAPTLTFTPTSPQVPGTTIQVSLGAGQFSSGDSASCTISSSPGGLFFSSGCIIDSGGKSITGTFFVVNSVPTGSTYTVTVKGSLGDSASTTFTVVGSSFGPYLVLNADSGSPGDTITFTAVGLTLTDTSCTLDAIPSGYIALAKLFVVSSCSISGGRATGTFVVNSEAHTDGNPYDVFLRSDPSGVIVHNQAGPPCTNACVVGFDVVPQITITPNIALPGQSVGFTGSGFNSGDTGSCGITPVPLLFSISSCSATGGVVGGSITILLTAPSGLYLVSVTGSTGGVANPHGGDQGSNYLEVVVLTTATSTSSTTTSSTTVTTTSTTSTSTNTLSSLSTTTLQTTGFSTWIFTSRTATTTLAETATTTLTTVISSSTATSFATVTTTLFTTFTKTFGQIIGPAVSGGTSADEFGLFALLLLGFPFVLRRLTH